MINYFREVFKGARRAFQVLEDKEKDLNVYVDI